MSESIDAIKALGTMIAALNEDEATRAQWSTDFAVQIDELEAKYAALKDDAQNDANAKRNMNALAKGIPAFSKGVIGAVQGFQKNDPLAGSAGVIDAVSSIITTVASMSSAAGPPGAIIGAILSVVSMILKLFSAQKPAKSLAQQLDEVIRKYDSEKYVQSLKSVQVLIEDFVETTPPKAYRTHTYAEALAAFNTKVPEPRQRIMDAAQWLKEPKNQELELWSVVLTAQCFAYIGYAQSLVTALSLIKSEADREKFRMDFIPTLSKPQLQFLQDILPVLRNRGTIWQSSRHGYLYKRTVVVSKTNSDWVQCGAAKGGEDARMQYFTVTTRPKQAHEAIAPVHPVWAQFSTESTFYDRHQYPSGRSYDKIRDTPFSSQGFERYKFRGRFGQTPFSQKYGVVLKPEVPNQKDLPHVYSVHAIPGKKAHQVWVYTTHGDRIMFWEHGMETHSTEEEQRLLKRGEFTMPEGYHMGQVRAVFPKHPPKATSSPAFFDGNSISAVYGACEVKAGKSYLGNNNTHNGVDHMEVKCYFMDHRYPNNPFRPYHQGALMSPWKNFVGIASDPHYLWVYRAGAIACATHGDVLNCLENGLAEPNWMVYKIPHEGISKQPYDPETEVNLRYNNRKKGLLDLDACEDGTLTAVFADANPLPVTGVQVLGTNIYSMTPVIDLQARTLKIEGNKIDDMGHKVPTSGWKTDRSAPSAYQVIKHPVFCWTVVVALIQSLEEVVAAHD